MRPSRPPRRFHASESDRWNVYASEALPDNGPRKDYMNQSGDVKRVKLGQRYEFGFADVSDWMYRNEVGVMQGCRTLRVLLADMPPDEAAQISASMGW